MPRKLKIQKRHDFDFDMLPNDLMSDIDEHDYKEPDAWTIITALNRVLDQARGSELTDEFWESVKNPLAYLRGELGMTDIQIVVLAILIEAGEPLSWKKMGNFLNVSRLQMMTYSEEKSVDFNIKDLAILSLKTSSRNGKSVAEDFAGIAVPKDFDILRIEYFFLHRF